MKNKILAITLPVIITLLILSTTIQVQATITWEEDFEDKDLEALDDWKFNAWYLSAGLTYPVTDSGFSVVDGILRAPNYQSRGAPGWNFTNAYHNNTVAYGTWSFDWVPAASPFSASDSIDYIAIIHNLPQGWNATGIYYADSLLTGYWVDIYQNTFGNVSKIDLTKVDPPGEIETQLGTYVLTSTVNEPIHIDVTRDQQGHFMVYADTELIIEATDNDYTTSQAFKFTSLVGDSGIDNITIIETTKKSTDSPSFTVITLLVTVMGLISVRRASQIKKH